MQGQSETAQVPQRVRVGAPPFTWRSSVAAMLLTVLFFSDNFVIVFFFMITSLKMKE
jgi:hypothetical protein